MRNLTLVLVLCASGCVVTDVGNPQSEPSTSQVRLEGYEREPETSAGGLVLDGGVELTHVWMTTDRLDLETCEGESDDEGRLELATDLLTGVTFPGPVALTKRESDFCRFRLDVRPLDISEIPEGAPDDLAGHSIVVRGLNASGTPFVIRADFTERFELEGDIRLRSDDSNALVVGFALNDWILGTDLSDLAEPIVIDPDTNVEVYERFEESVKASAKLFEDSVDGRVLAERP